MRPAAARTDPDFSADGRAPWTDLLGCRRFAPNLHPEQAVRTTNLRRPSPVRSASMIRFVALAVGLTVAASGAGVRAQAPRPAAHATTREYNTALGVDCEHCHSPA